MLQSIITEQQFIDMCIGMGINPQPPADSESLAPPSELDKFLKSQNADSDNGIIKIASFNIQVFGRSKVGKEDVMINLIKILNEFDLIAIQEIRDKTGDAIEKLHDRMGRSTWGLTVSPPLGRTISKEQYAFLYRKDLVELEFCDMWPDPDDLLHREPYLCSFESGDFDFTLINIHTDPDIVEQEINVLDDIYNQYSTKYEHLLLLGDLNAAPVDFDDLTRIPDVAWAIPQRAKTNTRGTKNYDNIIYNFKKLDEFHKGYVFDMQDRLSISEKAALRISDHNPVVIEIITGSEPIAL
jgi:endonuclease/exonuclease/phosphatase family metal-dependent hydrolase